MNAGSYLLLALVIVWAIFSVWHILRHGACSCGGKSHAENPAAAAVKTVTNSDENWYGEIRTSFFDVWEPF